jgi:hypothetical protein
MRTMNIFSLSYRAKQFLRLLAAVLLSWLLLYAGALTAWGMDTRNTASILLYIAELVGYLGLALSGGMIIWLSGVMAESFGRLWAVSCHTLSVIATTAASLWFASSTGVSGAVLGMAVVLFYLTAQGAQYVLLRHAQLSQRS